MLLDLRTLSEDEARQALQPWLDADGRRKSMRLFGEDAATSWTAAIISDLKPMAEELSLGRLRWVLSTAMPLRDDFHLYLNEQQVQSSKDTATQVGRWILAKDLVDVPKPAPSELASEVDDAIDQDDYRHWYFVDKTLGPISGYLEVFEDPIDAGKSTEMVGRSNGFFVYVHGRLVNPNDPGFGIDRNTLRHGTFSRFRVVIHIDRLDESLRSSREGLREGPERQRARDLLQGIFNFARTKLDDFQAVQDSERKVSQRLASSPASLSERPILHLILDTYEGGAPSRHVRIPDPAQFSDSDALRGHIEKRIEDGAGLVSDVVFGDLGSRAPIAVLDAVSGTLSINLEHPFVAHFADEFNDSRKNLPLQLFAVSEITLEAQLRSAAIAPEDIDTVLTERDDLLRHLARDSGRRNSITVAQELLNSASSKKELEDAVVDAFNQLGFEAVPKGAKNDPDGIADAFLPPTDGAQGPYRVSLEAKSKETPGAKVKKAAVEVSTIARHRDDNNCQHALVVGPEFETGKEDAGAVVQEIDDDRASHPGKTITLMEIRDLARLVRNAPVKRINLAQIRDLFQARTPAEASAWVDSILATDPDLPPYKDILEVVWTEQQSDSYTVDYSALRVALRTTRNRSISDEELRNDCTALAEMAPNLFVAHKDRVELNTKPDKVLDAIHGYIEQVPQEPE